jgi:hypothetical protein
MEYSGGHLRSVIRLFPDYANTVLWFAPGPIAYPDSHISDPLRQAMIEWEAAWYAGLTDELTWRSPAVERALTIEGGRIAHMLSDELGDAFEVEFGSTRLVGTSSGTNPSAVEAFRRMAREGFEEDERLRALQQGGSSWSAFAPESGDIYPPDH